jgi:hypothetical protein
MNGHMDPQTIRYISYGIPILLVLVIYFFRFRSAGKAQPLRPGALLIRPVYFVVILGLILWLARPFDAQSLGILAGCLIVGSAIGYWRGKMVHIEVHPETHAMSSVTPVFAVVLIVLLFIARFALKIFLFPNMGNASHESMLLNAYFVAFAVGAVGVPPIEMYFRANKLLAEAKAAKPA